tara:strand:- start:1128 stop:1928 length:801 start_codon:yes stop_codon:yes gene_type:complete
VKNLLLDNPVDEHLKPVKDSDGTSTVIELSTNKMRVQDLEVTGTTTGISASDDTKLPLAGGTMTGNVDFGDNDITNIDSLDADKLSIAGGTEMTAFIDADDMSTGASATTISSSESIKAYVDNSSKFFCTSAFYHGANNLEYIPIAGGSTIELSSLSDSGNDDTTFIVPYDLKINTVYVCATRPRSSDQIAGNTDIKLYKDYSALSGNITVNMSTIGYDSTDLATVYTFDFSSETNTYSAGDIMQISIDPTNKLYYVSMTIVGLYT